MHAEVREQVIGQRMLCMLCQLEQEMWHAANRKHRQATISFQEQMSATVQNLRVCIASNV